MRSLLALSLALLVALAGLRDVAAQDGAADAGHVLRFATLAPRGTYAERALRAWNRALRERTGGSLSVRVYWGGAMGDERSMIRRMRIGDLEGANLTTAALGSLVRETLALQVPGVLTTYEEVDRVRDALQDELRASFRAQGWVLLGIGDAGRIRFFSTEPITRPSDLRARRPWVREDDAIFGAFLEEVGANGVVLGVPEVLAGLRTGMIDVVPGTALVVGGLQWFSAISHMSSEGSGFLMGGMVLRGEWFDSLSETERNALLDTAAESQARVTAATRRADEEMFEALRERGIALDDVSAHRAEWRAVQDAVRARVSGRSVPPAFLDRVVRIARGGS